jgi:hypothetical protein
MATFLRLYGDLVSTELGSLDGDPASGNAGQRFTLTRRKDRINDAMQEFNRLTECFTRSFPIPIVDGTQEIELQAGITPGDYLQLAKQGLELQRVDAAGHLTTYSGPDLQRLEVAVLNAKFPGWRTASKGIPSGWYEREEGGQVFIGFNLPIAVAAGETWTLLVPYVASVPLMVADNDEPFTVGGVVKKVLRPWHQGLVHYAAAKLELLRRDVTASQAQMQAFGGYVADYLQQRRPKGGQTVQFARDYFRERAGRAAFPWQARDPRRD